MSELKNRKKEECIEWEDLTNNKGGVMKRILSEGIGNPPSPGDVIVCHYTLTLENGVEVDSSRRRNNPFTFTLGARQVIKAWDVGFASMKKGERCLLKATAPYAYGQSGSPPIPPNATLVFECELLSFGPSKVSFSPVIFPLVLIVLLYILLRLNYFKL